MEKVGFIGLGDIGAPMAERIALAGLDLTVWNRTAEKMTPLVDAGAKAAASAREIGETCDLVCICLDSVAAVEEVVFGPAGLTSPDCRMTLLVDHATLPSVVSQGFDTRLSKLGIGYLDAPVSGGAIGARAGTLAVMVGGDTGLVDRARPILASFGSRISHMGAVGTGQATKACNQILNFGNVATLAEALLLGRRYGLAPVTLTQAIEGGFAASVVSREYRRSLEAGDFSPIRFLTEVLIQVYDGESPEDLEGKLEVLMKDLDIALSMAGKTNSPLPVLSHFHRQFEPLHLGKPLQPIKT